MSKYPSQLQDRFVVRFPDGLRDAIADRAKQNGRSMNSEIIAAIEQALSSEPSGHDNKIAAEVSEILERVKNIEKQMKD